VSHDVAFRLCMENVSPDASRFYMPPGKLPIGAGPILSGCAIPLPSPTERKFITGLSIALVLTHECHLDQANDRAFNDTVLVVPVQPLQSVCDAFERRYGPGHTVAFSLRSPPDQYFASCIFLPHHGISAFVLCLAGVRQPQHSLLLPHSVAP
jgi:hypothetical protein